MFLLVPAYPGCPGSKAVKRSLLLLLNFYMFPCTGKAGRRPQRSAACGDDLSPPERGDVDGTEAREGKRSNEDERLRETMRMKMKNRGQMAAVLCQVLEIARLERAGNCCRGERAVFDACRPATRKVVKPLIVVT